MKLFSKYTAWLYIKYFFIIFFALELFYVGVDFLTNFKNIPNSANLQLLYIMLTSFTAINYVLPLSLVFAMVLVKFNMIRSNELVSFYALGISKNSLILTPFLISIFITLSYISLNFTNFAYSYEYQRNLSKFNQISRSSKDIFLKFENKFIYISELIAAKSFASGIKIFEVNNGKLDTQISAKSAKFSNKSWILHDVNLTKFPQNLELKQKGYEVENLENMEILHNFKPKIIENLSGSSQLYSIKDAIDLLLTLKRENLNLNSVKSTLYSHIFLPFFAPLMLLILYYFLPITGRFFNLALTSFIFILITLLGWGVLFLLSKFAFNGVIIPEFGIILPIFLMSLLALQLFNKHR